MAPAPAIQALQVRVDSFTKAKRVKRYPNKRQSTQSTSVKWPHPPHYKANADTLAEAGFFFTPTWEDRDCVKCFLCDKELSDWDPADDPFDIHYTKCRDVCAWAVVRCGLMEDINAKGNFTFANKARLPTCKAMEEARLKTFGENWWPHDKDPNHGPNSKKMAQAGFVYTPQAAGDDTVTCLYCNVALGGWGKDDDPIHEHRQRATKPADICPFFTAPAPKSGRPESSRSKESGKKSAVPHKRVISRTRSKKDEEARELERLPSPPPDSPIAVEAELMQTSPTPDPLEISQKPPVLPVTNSASRVENTPQRPMTVDHKDSGSPSRIPVLGLSPVRSKEVPTSPPNLLAQKLEEEPALKPPIPHTALTVREDAVPEPTSPISLPQPEGGVGQSTSPSRIEPLPKAMTIDEILKPPSLSPPLGTTTPHDMPRHPPPKSLFNSSAEVIRETSPVPGRGCQMMEDEAPQSILSPSHVLTEEERNMTLEEWIRREISLGHEKLMADGQGQISLFKERAAEIRKLIDEL